MPPKRANKKVEYLRIYVGRYALNGKLPSLTEGQKAVLAANTVRSWPDCYELFPTDDVKEVLRLSGVPWRDTKKEPVLPAAVREPANLAPEDER